MRFNIILEDKNKSYDDMFDKICEPIHSLLVGNDDYVKSNIVLNMDTKKDDNLVTNLYFYSECKDKEYIRQKAKEAIDVFIDNLREEK